MDEHRVRRLAEPVDGFAPDPGECLIEQAVAREHVAPHHRDGDAAAENRRQVVRRAEHADRAQAEIQHERDEAARRRVSAAR